MKHILAWSTAILFTALFAIISFDFHYSVVVSILSFVGSYAFWNAYYTEKKTAKRANA
ncbi:hypothetical protein [Staphylococcus sp. GDB9P120P]|uniref:hypothetical protein n=1 Tax=Staphylococcus sp. GDB9P120P TaxID=2804084 RepID=UPI001AEC4958|nr:hypothetical protein [Staphylococcus sp. GDB9P120P]